MSRQQINVVLNVLMAVIINLLINIVAGGVLVPLGPAWLLLVVAVVVEIVLVIRRNSHGATPQPSEPSPKRGHNIFKRVTPPSLQTPSKEKTVLQRVFSRRTVLIGTGVVWGGYTVAYWGYQGLRWLRWSESSIRSLYTYRGHSGEVTSVAWSPDGTHIASGSWDKTVQVWNPYAEIYGEQAFTYRGHGDEVCSVAWSPLDSKRIASSSWDGTVQVWDAADGGNVFTYRGHTEGGVYSIAWSPDGTRIASAGNDRTVQVWNVADGGNVFVYRGHAAEVCSVAWSPDGTRIASSSLNGTLRIWNAADGKLMLAHTVSATRFFPGVKADSFETTSFAWSPDGKRIVSRNASRPAEVEESKVADGSQVLVYHERLSTGIVSLAWSPDGKRIAVGTPAYHYWPWGDTKGYEAQVWDAADGGDGENLFTFRAYRGHTQDITSLSWSPDGARIVSGSYDKTVQIWEP